VSRFIGSLTTRVWIKSLRLGSTTLPGVAFSEFFPRMAAAPKELVVIWSFASGTIAVAL